MAVEVRDSLEIAHTAEYLHFLKCYFRAFAVVLLQIKKPQLTDNPQHKLRNIVVEILNRPPHSEVLRPFVQDLLKVAMQVLTTDNEENGLVCIRIIFDLLRNSRPTLDFVSKTYQNFRFTASLFFDNTSVVVKVDVKRMDTSSVSDQGITSSGYVGNGQLNPSTRSFKIVTESPLVVIFLFQLYSRLLQTNIRHLLPLMVAAISVPAPEKVPPHLKSHFIELKGAQVKTVSFLTYLLKSFADYIRLHEESICKSIVNLLVTCSDSVQLERVLVGTCLAYFETLRPLAYGLLAEIIHHVRGGLSLSQLLSWSWRRPLGMPLAPAAGGGSLNLVDFKHMVTTNVENVTGRISGIGFSEEENVIVPPQSVQKGVTELVDAALLPRNLCMMDPTWHPWF